MWSGYASAENSSPGTTTTGNLTKLLDDKLIGVGVIQQHWESLEILKILAFDGAHSLTPGVDSIAGTATTGP